MKFNYGLERRKFEKHWDELRKAYKTAGMNEEDIQEMYGYDWEDFKRYRIYCMHNQSLQGAGALSCNVEKELESDITIPAKYIEAYSETFDIEDFAERYGWLDELENEPLHKALRELKEDDIELLTLWAIEGWTEKEIAEKRKISKSAISQKITRIRKLLKRLYSPELDS